MASWHDKPTRGDGHDPSRGAAAPGHGVGSVDQLQDVRAAVGG
jgi:hypothetical protein